MLSDNKSNRSQISNKSKSEDDPEFVVEDEHRITLELEEKLMNEIIEAKLVEDNAIEPISEEDHQSVEYEEDVEKFFEQVNKNDTAT